MATHNNGISKLSKEELLAEIERRESEEKSKKANERAKFEADKNDFTKISVSKFQQLQNELSELKEYTIREANKLYERMYRINDKEPKETKSFSIKNDGDTVKVSVERQERFEFTEEATVHINAIKDIFKEKFQGRNKGMYAIMDGLLVKGSKKEYDPKLLAKARLAVKDLGDANLIAELDKLEDCQRVVGTSLYCRLYMRDDKNKWRDISLQFSAL